jgi:hypothetical protein
VTEIWCAVALVALVAYYPIRWWLAFRAIRALNSRRQRLGNPVGRPRSAIEDVLGPPTQSAEDETGARYLVWLAEGRFSVLDIYVTMRSEVFVLRFRDGICADVSEGRNGPLHGHPFGRR